MVEMRWFVNSEFVKVLQYRQLVTYSVADGNLHAQLTYSVADGNLHAQLIDKQPVWSDWIDVPTVTE
jgi:hypothetical protein